jgi:RNA polymerase sigma-70 factor (ECF subfamily)
MDDAKLMHMVAEGDRDAFVQLYDRYAARVHGLTLYILRDPMLAEEATQETFLKVWTRADTFRPERGRFPTWLLTIARRLALDRLRLEARRPPADSTDPEEAWQDLPDPVSETEEARWRSMKLLVADLPAEQRRVIEYAFYFGLSHSQIAAELSLPLGTVKTRLRLAMEKLRGGLQTVDREGARTSA